VLENFDNFSIQNLSEVVIRNMLLIFDFRTCSSLSNTASTKDSLNTTASDESILVPVPMDSGGSNSSISSNMSVSVENAVHYNSSKNMFLCIYNIY